MKQFMLTGYSEYNGEYQLVLGNRSITSFPSKRKVLAFIAETNRFLNKLLIESNLLFSSLFAEYRNAWLSTMNFKCGNRTNYLDTERKMEKNILDIMDQFNRVANTYNGSSQGCYSFKHLQNICFYMIDLTNILIHLQKKSNHIVNYHNLEILKDRLIFIQNKLTNYPETLPKDALKIHRN